MLRESLRRIVLAARMLLLDVARRRLTLLLLFLVPAVFDAVVLLTTKEREVEVTIASLVEEGAEIHEPGTPDLADFQLLDGGARKLGQRALSLVFLGNAAVSFLACFLGFDLVHQRRDPDARLTRAGFAVHELLAAKLMVLAGVVVALAVYQTALVQLWVSPKHLLHFASGFTLGGTVYGALGLFVGAVSTHELEGIFGIVLLTNVDVGWLQNPIYYASSTGRSLIERLPGHCPTQVALTAAFGDDVPRALGMRSLAYAVAALSMALLVLVVRARWRR